MTLKKLIQIYCEMNDIDPEENPGYVEAEIAEGNIDLGDLLDAYLRNEGIFGYTHEIGQILKIAKQNNIGWITL